MPNLDQGHQIKWEIAFQLSRVHQRTPYAYVAEDDTELFFEPGAIITEVRPSSENEAWIEANLEGMVGEASRIFMEFLD